MSFSQTLRDANAATWDAATSHKFVRDLWASAVPDPVMKTYLSQDYLFCDAFFALMGAAVSHADSPSARLVIARQLGMITTDEDGYFLRALRRLDPGFEPAPSSTAQALAGHSAYAPHAATAGFLQLMDGARASYAAALTVLLVAEWLYLDWAGVFPSPPTPGDWLYAEWIELHRGAAFEGWVQLLRDELDRVAAAAGEEEKKEMEALFARAVKLELEFFDAAYE
jgi:thiaminase/transcriptional activator TenA